MPTATTEFAEILLSKISPAADNIRSHVDPSDIEDLADSIRAQGILEPIIVTPNEKGTAFEIVAGHRRHAAAKLAGLKKAPCMVRTFATPADRLLAMLTENLQRVDIDPIDEARAYDRLIKELKIKQKDLASMVGRSQGHISKRTTLLKLPNIAHDAIRAGHLDLTLAHDLAGITDVDVVAGLVKKGAGRWDVEHALKSQRNAAAHAKGLKELERHGIPEAPGEARWKTSNWEVMTGPLGATHGFIDTAARGDVVWYRQRTDEEIESYLAEQEKERAASPSPSPPAKPKAKETPAEKAAREKLEAQLAAQRAHQELHERIRHDHNEFVRDHLTGKRFDTSAASAFLADALLAAFGVGHLDDDEHWAAPLGEDLQNVQVCELVGITLPPESKSWQAAAQAIAMYIDSSPASARLVVATAAVWANYGDQSLSSVRAGEGLDDDIVVAHRYLEALGYVMPDDEKAEIDRITTAVVEDAGCTGRFANRIGGTSPCELDAGHDGEHSPQPVDDDVEDEAAG